MRRSPMAVVFSADAGPIGSLFEALGGHPELDVTGYVLTPARRLGPPVRFEPPSGRVRRGLPPDVDWVRVAAWTLDPELLVAGMAARWLRGPRARRPSVLLGVGLLPAGYVAGGVARVLGVPSAVLLLPPDSPGGDPAADRSLDELETRRGRRALGVASLLACGEDRTADALVRRGFDPILATARNPEATWAAVGHALAREVIRGRTA